MPVGQLNLDKTSKLTVKINRLDLDSQLQEKIWLGRADPHEGCCRGSLEMGLTRVQSAPSPLRHPCLRVSANPAIWPQPLQVLCTVPRNKFEGDESALVIVPLDVGAMHERRLQPSNVILHKKQLVFKMQEVC